MNYKEIQSQYEFEVYPKRDITLVKAKGSKVWDSEGKEYIDCGSGHGVVCVGHCNESVSNTICNQAQKQITSPGIFYNDRKAQLLEKLISIAPSGITKAFFCNSGTESVEAALKFARGSTSKSEFICAMRGFHGRTFGAMSATFNKKYKDHFKPLVQGFSFVPFNKFDRLCEKVTDNTAAILLEVVQGEGGVNPGKQEYFTQVQKLCDEKGILLIIDEVQTGFCRTGKMFASSHFNLRPDMICLAKGIANGVPMGAVLCSSRVSEPPLGGHGTTFGGNPLACAAALATITFLEENNCAQMAQKKGEYIKEKIRSAQLEKVREVRGLGLMIGIELKEKVKPFILALLDKGVIVLPAGSTVLRLLPPLTISYEEIDVALEKIINVLS